MSDILHSSKRSLGVPMLFSVLPAEAQEQLRARAPTRAFSAGQVIAQRGDAADGFWLLESGSVSVGQFLPDGEFRGVAVIGPGDSWGELAIFASRPRVVDAIARTQSDVRYIGSALLEEVLRAQPEAMRALLGALSQQLQEMLDVVAGIRRGTAAARVAGLLATMSEGSELPVEIPISQQELADLLGLTRATVNSALRDQERQGLINRKYGAVTVLDRTGLAGPAMR